MQGAFQPLCISQPSVSKSDSDHERWRLVQLNDFWFLVLRGCLRYAAIEFGATRPCHARLLEQLAGVSHSTRVEVVAIDQKQ
jgi:hypothetical protein